MSADAAGLLLECAFFALPLFLGYQGRARRTRQLPRTRATRPNPHAGTYAGTQARRIGFSPFRLTPTTGRKVGR